jgi:hypothetical protein
MKLPHIFVGDEAYPVTTYIMKPYSRRTLDRNKACSLGICASKWRILDKSIEAKVDAGVEIVKYIALLHSIIIDVEGLHDFSSFDCGNLDEDDGTQFKKCGMRNSVTASAKQT